MIREQIQSQSRIDKKFHRNNMQTGLALSAGLLLLGASYFGFAAAETGQSSSSDTQIKATNAIKNDPKMMSILENIELFKQKYAALQQEQNLITQQQQMIDEKRKIANAYLQADLAKMNSDDSNNPKNSYAGFVSKVDNSTQNLFWDEFAYMQSKADQARLAMNQALHNGATREQALNAYYSVASSQKTDLVSVNKDLNIKYNLADSNTQDQFNKYGNLKKYSAS